MTGKTHKTIGICVGVAFTYWGIKTYGSPVFALSTLAAAAGAMLPDIDHNSTRLGSNRKAFFNIATKIFPLLFGLVVLWLCLSLAASNKFMQIVILLLLIILPVIILSLIAQLSLVKKALKFASKHRGLMHTLTIPLLLCLGFMLIPNDAVRYCLLAAAAGYASHLFLDCLNKTGCPILWPIISKNISLMPIKTGSKDEYIVSYALIGLMILLFFFGAPALDSFLSIIDRR